MTMLTALEAPVQPINPAAVVDAALRAIYSVYGSSEGLDFVGLAAAIRENQGAKEELEGLLVLAGSEDEDGLNSFGPGMVAGCLYAASTGITLMVPPLAELKAALEAQEAEWEAMRKATPDASQVA
jgi:hypothetical protein